MRTAKAPKPNIEALQDAVFKIDPDAIVIFGGANGIDIRIKAGAHNQVTFRSNTLAGIIAEALHFTPPESLNSGPKTNAWNAGSGRLMENAGGSPEITAG